MNEDFKIKGTRDIKITLTENGFYLIARDFDYGCEGRSDFVFKTGQEVGEFLTKQHEAFKKSRSK